VQEEIATDSFRRGLLRQSDKGGKRAVGERIKNIPKDISSTPY
jgi:hypothetical protein